MIADIEQFNDIFEIIALSFFLITWKGYNLISERISGRNPSLTSALFYHRTCWVKQMFYQSFSNGEMIAMGNLERTVAFFASSSILVLAGLLTLLNSSYSVWSLLHKVPFIRILNPTEIQIRLLILVFIFIYVFFKCTWSMRQYGFCITLIGSIASKTKGDPLNSEESKHAQAIVDMLQQASVNFNLALRACYFSIAFIGDLLHPGVLILGTVSTAYVLYSREFESPTLRSLIYPKDLSGKKRRQKYLSKYFNRS